MPGSPRAAGVDPCKLSSICFSSVVVSGTAQERGIAREVSKGTYEHSGAQR